MSALLGLPLHRTTVSGGFEIHFAEEGRGTPLVFIHGGMGDWSSWAPQWDTFTRHFRCITYSRRFSSPNQNVLDSGTHSVFAEAQDLVQLLEQWCEEPAILVGTSYGAYTALQTALAAPGRVLALVLTEPPVLPFADEVPGGQEARLQFQREVLDPATEAFRQGDADRAVRMLTDGINGQGPGEAGTADGRARRLRNAEAIRALCVSSDAYPALDRDALRALRQPVLLTHGDRTQAIHRATTSAVSRYLAHARVAQVRDSGHGAHRDNPSDFNALVLDFLRESCPDALRGALPTAGRASSC
ncbi:alpha/beta fold hydrolase [Hydrogenophaga palleronii]|uniref:alpha/beta fold hydrolase n=1 Tax=Hydrogenophaga palleronii TaxID=65655 RepID=UPI000825D243|nr:alpha/beta hydrolase [Hydrogenophaga palleronii]